MTISQESLVAATSPIAATARWQRLLARVYGYRAFRLDAKDGAGNTIGTLPLCEIASPVLGKRLVSLPFDDSCPLDARDPATAGDLVQQAIAFARRRGARYLELRTGANAVLAAMPQVSASDLYVRWRLALTPGAEAIFGGVKPSARRQIRKAERAGVVVRAATCRADVAAYYHLHLHTRTRKHGMPAQPLRYFEALWDTYAAGDGLRLLLAEHEGQPIAGMLFLAEGETLRYAYGASDERFLRLGPNDLLLWQGVRWACERGFRTLDLGRTARDNEGLNAFKAGWSAVSEPLTYYYYPARAGLAATAEHSLRYRLLTGVWRRLPLPLAGALGGALYRHLG
jgi:CelD/BcsL family acetyltransferase involved in cellulose biosynthesis